MDRIRIRGGRPLSGDIVIGGAKNAALPLMAAALLTDQRLVLSNVPRLADIQTMGLLLAQHGIAVDPVGNDGRTLSLGGAITSTEAPYDIVRKMRASVLVLGPLLARMGEARVSMPGGCAIGARPIDLHLKGLEQMGATFRLDGGYIDGDGERPAARRHHRVPVRLGRRHREPADGGRAGRWPHRAGQRRARAGDRRPGALPERHGRADRGHRQRPADHRRRGPPARRGARHHPGPDRDRHLRLRRRDHRRRGHAAQRPGWSISAPRCAHLREAGVEIVERPGGLHVRRLNGLHGADVMTEPYPGFPTDMQAQFMALMAVSDGAAMVTETIFENRFMHVPELNRMGARINVHGASAIVRGVPALSGAPVMATDLRASVSLILAGLAARGETVVNRVYHLDRGYEAVEQKLAACGADIERLRDD